MKGTRNEGDEKTGIPGSGRRDFEGGGGGAGKAEEKRGEKGKGKGIGNWQANHQGVWREIRMESISAWPKS